MNLFTSIKNKIVDKRLERLKKQLVMLSKKDFQSFVDKLPTSIFDCEGKLRTMAENYVWFSANTRALHDFYIADTRTGKLNFYWKNCPKNERIVHSGIPSLISEKMATIIFGPGIDFNYTLINKGDEVTFKQVADSIFSAVDLGAKLNCAAQNESWAGHVAFKISYDLNLCKLPILEVVDRRNFEVVKERGILRGIKFFTNYCIKDGTQDKRYRLIEYYSTNENGFATIDSALYEMSQTPKQVPLTTIPQTANLEAAVVFSNFKGMLAFEKANLPSGEDYGRSDYARAYSVYDALDEVLSGIVNELRQNRTLHYIPESMIPVDDQGNFTQMSAFITNFVTTKADYDQNGTNKVETSIIPDKTAEHMEKYRILIGQACNLSGLSPLSLGVTGLESINSSDKSTRERSKSTLETRKAKIVIWKSTLENLASQFLKFTQFLQNNLIVENEFDIRTYSLDQMKVNVTFNDYVETGIEDRISIWATAKSAGIVSTDMAVKRVYVNELSEEEKQQEVQKIKLEQNMLIDPDDKFLKLGDYSDEEEV